MNVAVIFVNVMDLIGWGFIGLILLLAMAVNISSSIKQRFCKHERTYKFGGDIICSNCGKDFGRKGPIK